MSSRRPPLILACLPAAMLGGALLGYWQRPPAPPRHPLLPPGLAGATLFGKNLRGARLAGKDLSGACLAGKDPCSAHLAGANLTGRGGRVDDLDH